jgi:hypothetical protein
VEKGRDKERNAVKVKSGKTKEEKKGAGIHKAGSGARKYGSCRLNI